MWRRVKAVLDAIVGTAKTLTVIPEPEPVRGADLKPIPNAHAQPDSEQTATRLGGKCEHDLPGQANGKGGGSNVTLAVTPKDFAAPSSTAPLNVRDEALLHWLVHALRQMRGLEDDAPSVTAPIAMLRRGEASQAALMANGLFDARDPALERRPYSQVYNAYEES